MSKVFPFLDTLAIGAAIDTDVKPCDQVLIESENFVVVPTTGALVEGWLLIVTKRQYLCMGAIGAELRGELAQLKDRISAILQPVYGNSVVFEHGPHKAAEKIGCGVDHAHLHVVPAYWDLIEAIPDVTQAPLRWESADGFLAAATLFEAGIPYLYIEQPSSEPKIAVAWDAPSQLFRRVIANRMGIPDQYDWRRYPMVSNVVSTIQSLHGRFSRYRRSNDTELVIS